MRMDTTTRTKRTKIDRTRTIERIAYGIAEFASMMAVSPSFVRLELARGNLKGFRVGRRVLITKASADEYVAARS
jgi:excisionase family DNA binding protein